MSEERADRYTVHNIHVNELPTMLEHAGALGLKFFVTFGNYPKEKFCQLYIFFDDMGMENYLNRTWGHKVDRLREIIEQGIQDDEPAANILEQLQDELDIPPRES